MKRIILPLIVLCFAASALPVAAQVATLAAAQKAYMAGDIATAKALFEQVLKSDPENIAARNYLKNIAISESQVPGAKAEKQFQSLILPQVQFKNASLDSVLDALKEQVVKASNGQMVVNIVVQPGVDTSKTLTLSLNNVPLREVMRYVGEMTKSEIVYERYAIVLKPKSSTAQAPAGGTAPGQ